jgi:Tfp pilus assembly protein PilF
LEEEKSRLEQFKEFVQIDPSDTFSRYALGMEYLGASQFDEAREQFEEVIRLDPKYTAAYFQAAIACQRGQKIDQARTLLTKGIEVAGANNDWHARDEMTAALHDLDLLSR